MKNFWVHNQIKKLRGRGLAYKKHRSQKRRAQFNMSPASEIGHGEATDTTPRPKRPKWPAYWEELVDMEVYWDNLNMFPPLMPGSTGSLLIPNIPNQNTWPMGKTSFLPYLNIMSIIFSEGNSQLRHKICMELFCSPLKHMRKNWIKMFPGSNTPLPFNHLYMSWSLNTGIFFKNHESSNQYNFWIQCRQRKIQPSVL